MKCRLVNPWIGSAAALLAGCTSLSLPYVSDRVPPKELDEASSLGCRAPVFQREAREACALLRRLERFQNEQVGWRSYLNGALIALGGHVAYQSTRATPSRALASVSAVGLSSYALGTLSLPERRAFAYHSGVSALSCALTEYNAAVSTNGAWLRALHKADADRSLIWKRLEDPKFKARIPATTLAVSRLDSSLPSPSSSIDAQLGKFTTSTLKAVNEIIGGTLPTSSQVASDVARLSNQSDPARQGNVVNAFTVPDFSAYDASFTPSDEITTLLSKYAASLIALSATPPASVNVDFSSCSVAPPAPGDAAYKPLDLGAGNSVSGKELPLVAGAAPLEIPLLNGKTPFTVTVDSVGQNAQVKAEIIMQGGVLLRVTPPGENSTADVIARITVTDIVGAIRSFQVKIPKK